MITTLTQNKIIAEPAYPKIKRLRDDAWRGGLGDGELIVLFTDINTGFVLHVSDGSRKVGFNQIHWAEKQFENYNGQVTLEN